MDVLLVALVVSMVLMPRVVSRMMMRHAHLQICSTLEIVDIQQIRAGSPQQPPNSVAVGDGPGGLVPVPHADPFAMSSGDLTLK